MHVETQLGERRQEHTATAAHVEHASAGEKPSR
jgi:hypothetical protein